MVWRPRPTRLACIATWHTNVLKTQQAETPWCGSINVSSSTLKLLSRWTTWSWVHSDWPTLTIAAVRRVWPSQWEAARRYVLPRSSFSECTSLESLVDMNDSDIPAPSHVPHSCPRRPLNHFVALHSKSGKQHRRGWSQWTTVRHVMLTECHELNDSCDSNMSTDHPTMHLFGVICNNWNVQILPCGLAEMPEVPSSAVTCQRAAVSRHPQSSQLVRSCNRLTYVVTRRAGRLAGKLRQPPNQHPAVTVLRQLLRLPAVTALRHLQQ